MGNRTFWIAGAALATLAALAGVALPSTAYANAYIGVVALLAVSLVGVVGLVVQMQAPLLGYALLVVMGVFFPLEFRAPGLGVSVGAAFPLAALLCAVWLLHFAFVSRIPLDRSRLVASSLVFVGLTMVSFLAGQLPWFDSGGAPVPAQIAELALFLVSVLLLLAVGHQLTSLRDLKWLTWLLIVTGMAAALIQSVPSLESVGRMTTHQGSVGSLFWTWLAAVSFAQALYNRGLPWPARGFALAVTALVFFHGLYQARDWASGWLPPLIAVGVISLLRFPRTTVAAAVVVGPAVLLLGRALLGDIETDEEYSMSTRWGALLTLWNLVKRSPIVGTGLANYYYFTENLPIMGWYVRFISHNNYQDLLVQTGLLGLLAFCWFGFEAIWLTLYVFRKAPAGFPKAYAVAALGGIAGSLASGMLGDWVIPFYYNAGILGFRSSLLFWVFVGGILTIKRQIESEAWVGAERMRATPATPRRPLRVQPAASTIAS